ncbi:MAG TPA: hypothetical protein VGF59_25640 [Bryobacteraceae bacterium]
MTKRPDVDAAVQQIESIVAELGEPGAELVRLLMELYGAGLARAMEILGELNAQEAIGRLADDKLVGSLLLLHGLHPVDAASRVRAALSRLERSLHWHDLVLDGVSEGVACIRVVRNGAGPAPNGLREAIERAVAESAPDLGGVEIEGLENPSALVQIETAPGR